MSHIHGYILSIEADHDLEEIFEYTENKFGIDQAIKYLQEFDVLFNHLVQTPALGKERNEIKNGLRSIPKGSHVVFYRIMNDKIRIVRILHGMRDLPRFFK